MLLLVRKQLLLLTHCFFLLLFNLQKQVRNHVCCCPEGKHEEVGRAYETGSYIETVATSCVAALMQICCHCKSTLGG